MKQPDLTVTSKSLIEVDGFKFKDLNGNGILDAYEDWRLTSEERAKDLVSQMTTDEKVGMMLINQMNMGKAKKEGDNTQVLDEEFEKADGSPMKRRDKYPSTETMERLKLRHFILRDNMPSEDIAEWVNKVNEVAEATRLGIPALIASNSRNENSDVTIEGDKTEGSFSLYPGTLGIAAAVQGELSAGADYTLVEEFAETVRKEWLAAGIRKGYMYMADIVTDPRWQRSYGTFGENPDLVGEIISRLIPGIQGEKLSEDSIAMTIKHFPGGGPRENGFDPHYLAGKWNVYRTPGSLEDYHLPPFTKAVEKNPSSIMPYYSAPSIEKSHWQAIEGEIVPFEEVGMAFNAYMLQTLLRDKLGFKGYVNSDSGVTDNTAWGMEEASVPVRFAKVVNAGTDIIGATNDVGNLKAAVVKNFIAPQRIDQANVRLLKEMFDLGLFDDKTYVDVEAAKAVRLEQAGREKAYEAHLKSVTLLKNEAGLPVGKDKVYVEAFHKNLEKAEKITQNAREVAKELGISLVDDYKEAETAILFLQPESGDYFNATPGLLELEICEDKTNIAMNGDTYKETTLSNYKRFEKIADEMRAAGKTVVASVNITLPWILGNVEPKVDILIAGYDTFLKAQLEVLIGNYQPKGKLPLTLPKNTAVIAVDEHGVCVSRNDVPGYDKDKYFREGMTYAYEDTSGNVYKFGYGLTK